MSPLDQLTPEMLSALISAAQDKLKEATAATKPTIADLWERWEPWGIENIPSWRINSTHKKQLVAFFGALKWDECTAAVADEFYSAQAKTLTKRKTPPSPTYVQRQLTTLHSMLTWHQERGHIPRNPLAGFRRIDEEPYARQTYLTEAEFERFISGAHPTFQDVCRVAIRCAGMRNSEARLLQKAEVSMERRTISLISRRTKSKRPRVIPFGEEVTEILVRNMANSRGPYVFVRPNDPMRVDPVPIGTMQGWLVRARERSGMTGVDGETIVVHTLRHSGVTQLLSDGANIAAVQQAAGLSARVLPRYAKFSVEAQEQLREVMERRGPQRVVSGENLSAKSTRRR